MYDVTIRQLVDLNDAELTVRVTRNSYPTAIEHLPAGGRVERSAIKHNSQVQVFFCGLLQADHSGVEFGQLRVGIVEAFGHLASSINHRSTGTDQRSGHYRSVNLRRYPPPGRDVTAVITKQRSCCWASRGSHGVKRGGHGTRGFRPGKRIQLSKIETASLRTPSLSRLSTQDESSEKRWDLSVTKQGKNVKNVRIGFPNWA